MITPRCVMTTFTGREVNPLNLQETDVCLADVAHALALTNRFGGHTKFPISVAQHAVFVSALVEGDFRSQWRPEDTIRAAAWQALHHDDSEYLLGDMPKWVKHQPQMDSYREAEDHVQATCYRAFGVIELYGDYVEVADRIMVRYEAMMAYDQFHFDDKFRYPPITTAEDLLIQKSFPGGWSPWSWEYAESMFLMKAERLVPGSAKL